MSEKNSNDKKMGKFLGRLCGWFLLVASILAASAEAVVALGAGEHVSIATSDVITIITGVSPENISPLASEILMWPAWVIVGSTGLCLVLLCRRKKFKTAFGEKI